MMTLSQKQMLAQWKMRHYLEPLREDCSEVRDDGVNIDYLVALEMRDWYLNLLDTAPLRMVSVTDIIQEVAVDNRPDNGAVVINLPEACRRVVSIWLSGIAQEIIPITDLSDYRVILQQSEYSRGGKCIPVAVLSDAGLLTIYGYDSDGNPPEIEHLYAVMCPEDGVYILDESALKTIPTIKI